MPLLDVLDEESGLGFDGGVPMDSPLLEGLPFEARPLPASFPAGTSFSWHNSPGGRGSDTWALEDAAVEALATPDPPPFPQSFAALATLEASGVAALDRGEFQFWMEQFSGPTAARWLGGPIPGIQN